jgi:hypothetical protein
MVQCAWEEAGSRMARVHEEAFDADGNARPVNVRLIMEDRGR